MYDRGDGYIITKGKGNICMDKTLILCLGRSMTLILVLALEFVKNMLAT